MCNRRSPAVRVALGVTKNRHTAGALRERGRGGETERKMREVEREGERERMRREIEREAERR